MSHIHFTGIGGVGMAGLAHLVADLGDEVTGSDAVDSPMLVTLRQRGVPVVVGHASELPGCPALLVYSSAVPEDNAERQCAVRRGIPQMRRGDFLAQLSRRFAHTVAVSGSHGKTTTTAMIAHICRQAGLEPGYLVGGAVQGWHRAATAGNGRLLITEVDESDGSQEKMAANIAVVLNVDDDHCWSLGGVEQLENCFVNFARQAEQLLTWRTATTERLFAGWQRTTFLEQPLPETAGAPPQPGTHNRINAAMAVAVAATLGVKREAAIEALRGFSGVDRRMSLRHRSDDGNYLLIEDYAHHPTELRAVLSALREAYPHHRQLVLFQPHRYERVKRYGVEFAAALSTVDCAWVVAPFAAWRQDQTLAEPEAIARAIAPGVAAGYLPNEPGAMAVAVRPQLLQQAPCLLAVIGAGDIGQAVPELLRIMPE